MTVATRHASRIVLDSASFGKFRSRNCSYARYTTRQTPCMMPHAMNPHAAPCQSPTKAMAPIALYGSVIGAMALVGLWHGAAWGFIAWGIMHGVCLVVYRAYEQLRDRNFPKLAESRTIRLAWRVATVIAVTAAWVPFRANSLGQAGTMFARMTFAWTWNLSYSVSFYLATLLLCMWCLSEPFWSKVTEYCNAAAAIKLTWLRANTYLLRPLAYAFALLLFVIFDDQDIQFIYFQF